MEGGGRGCSPILWIWVGRCDVGGDCAEGVLGWGKMEVFFRFGWNSRDGCCAVEDGAGGIEVNVENKIF